MLATDRSGDDGDNADDDGRGDGEGDASDVVYLLYCFSYRQKIKAQFRIVTTFEPFSLGPYSNNDSSKSNRNKVPRAAQTGLRVPWPVRASDSYS